jgi:hypothetical protein
MSRWGAEFAERRAGRPPRANDRGEQGGEPRVVSGGGSRVSGAEQWRRGAANEESPSGGRAKSLKRTKPKRQRRAAAERRSSPKGASVSEPPKERRGATREGRQRGEVLRGRPASKVTERSEGTCFAADRCCLGAAVERVPLGHAGGIGWACTLYWACSYPFTSKLFRAHGGNYTTPSSATASCSYPFTSKLFRAHGSNDTTP